MTDDDLILAAYQRRVIDVPGCGFLLDDRPAADDLYPALIRLMADGLLVREEIRGDVDAFLLPSAAALDVIGVSHR